MATRSNTTGQGNGGYQYHNEYPNQRNAKPRGERVRDFLEDNSGFRLIAWGVFLGLVSVAIKVMTVNIAPYLILFGSPIPAPSNIPIIGWLFDLLVVLFMGFGASIVWAIVNFTQLVWILIYFDTKAARAAAKESQRTANDFGDVSGDRELRKVKRRATRIPFFFMVASGYAALVAFIVEFCISLRAYPPFKDWGEMWAGLMIGDFSPIDGGNLLNQLWCVFSTEIVVIAVIVAWQWVKYSRRG